MVSPVLGLRPSRAARGLTLNVPNPINVTSSPFFSALIMLSTVAFNAAVASCYDKSAISAMCDTKSFCSCLYFLSVNKRLFVFDGHYRQLKREPFTLSQH